MTAEVNHTLVIARPMGILKLFDSRPVMILIEDDTVAHFDLFNGNLMEVDCRSPGVAKTRTYFVNDINSRKVTGTGVVEFEDRSHYLTKVSLTVARDTKENLEVRMSSIKDGVRI